MQSVAVIRGGPSSEYDISLLSGANVLDNLKKLHYSLIDIVIDPKGQWFRDQVKTSPENALRGIDVAFNAVHGQFGEDGRLQDILQHENVRFTGAAGAAATLSLDKDRSKEVLKRHGIKSPVGKVLENDQSLRKNAENVFATFKLPVMVKPLAAGSSVGMTLAKDFNQFWDGIQLALQHSSKVLVEEYLKGKEATAGVIEGLRGQRLYTTLVTEIIPPASSEYFDREVKYNGQTVEITPGNFTNDEVERIQQVARLAHQELGLRQYSRSDFIIMPNGLFYLETNSAAGVGLTKESLFPKALAADGIKFEEFLNHVLQLALHE